MMRLNNEHNASNEQERKILDVKGAKVLEKKKVFRVWASWQFPDPSGTKIIRII